MTFKKVITTEDRFWAKVDRSGGPDSCWEWTGYRLRGYGRFSVVINGKRAMVPAQRVAYWISTGREITGVHICHRCDNPPCCNPSHLFAGTNFDNIADMVSKGRQRAPRGANNAKSKLSPAQVAAIRDEVGRGVSKRSIARRFGVSDTSIRKVVSGRSWSHV